MKSPIEVLLLQKNFCEAYLARTSNETQQAGNGADRAYVTAQHALATSLLLLEEQKADSDHKAGIIDRTGSGSAYDPT
jgi:hypothetical protein